MYVASGPMSDFVQRHPTVKMLALSFLLMIGVSLVADGLGFHIPRGYIYFAMAFSTMVEVFNIFVRSRRSKPTGCSASSLTIASCPNREIPGSGKRQSGTNQA